MSIEYIPAPDRNRPWIRNWTLGDATKAQSQLEEISDWIDDFPVNRDADPLAAFLLRYIKVFEEAGEMVGNIIGMTGQNPRKGVTSSLEEVLDEAADTALTILGAIESATGNRGESFGRLFEKISKVHARMEAFEKETQQSKAHSEAATEAQLQQVLKELTRVRPDATEIVAIVPNEKEKS